MQLDWERDVPVGVGSDERGKRQCVDCGAPASWMLLGRDGTFRGFVCATCDDQRRRRRNVWYRRCKRRIRRLLRE